MEKKNFFNSIKKLEDKKILITGASGWLGRECISLMLEVFDKDFIDSITLAGSSKKIIEVDGSEFQISSLTDIAESPQVFDLIINLASVTRGKLNQLSEEDFLALNLQIRESCKKIISRSRGVFFFQASSGAVAEIEAMRSKDKSYWIYAQSKLVDEQVFTQAISDVGGRIGICRIYSITGNQLIIPDEFAIGSIMKQALTTNAVVLSSPIPVLRKYVDAKDIFKVCISRLLDEAFIMESGGVLIELKSLAQLITQKYNPEAITESALNLDLNDSDDYFSKSDEFEKTAQEFGLQLVGINEQIENIFFSVQKSLSTNQ